MNREGFHERRFSPCHPNPSESIINPHDLTLFRRLPWPADSWWVAASMAATSPALLYDAPAGLLCPDTAAPLCTTGATRFPLHCTSLTAALSSSTGLSQREKTKLWSSSWVSFTVQGGSCCDSNQLISAKFCCCISAADDTFHNRLSTEDKPNAKNITWRW